MAEEQSESKLTFVRFKKYFSELILDGVLVGTVLYHCVHEVCVRGLIRHLVIQHAPLVQGVNRVC